MKTRIEEKSVWSALSECLADVPFCSIEPVESERSWTTGRQPDLVARLRLPDRDVSLVVECKPNGQPRLAREAVNQLVLWLQQYPGTYGVFVAPYISVRAAEICRRAGVGYADLSGNCHLCFGQVYISNEGRPNKFSKKRDLRSLYAAKATRVLRVLLLDPSRHWKVAVLAKEAGVSVGQVSNVKKLLADREWIRSEKGGLRLIEPAAALAEWSENHDFRRSRARDFYSFDTARETDGKLADVCRSMGVGCALTGFSAAAYVAPSVRYQRVMAYVQSDISDVARRLGLKEVPTGANVTLLSPYDEGVFYGAVEIDGVTTVSAVQAYLDLMKFRGRGEEAAAALLEEVIKPTW